MQSREVGKMETGKLLPMNTAQLQRKLNGLGYDPIPVNGVHGPKTTIAIRDFQKEWNRVHPDEMITVDGIAGPETLGALFRYDDIPHLLISQRSLDMLVNFEIGSIAYYESHLTHPCYPGSHSGITIGIGYDLGYHDATQVVMDWRDVISRDDLEKLLSAVGLRGPEAKEKLPEVHSVYIPLWTAKKVFLERSLPLYAKEALDVYPDMDRLLPDAAGGILSLVYNRGASVIGSTRREMYNLRALIQKENYTGMAREIRSMKRLWDGVSDDGREGRIAGLLTRREEEADLVENARKSYRSNELVKVFV